MKLENGIISKRRVIVIFLFPFNSIREFSQFIFIFSGEVCVGVVLSLFRFQESGGEWR